MYNPPGLGAIFFAVYDAYELILVVKIYYSIVAIGWEMLRLSQQYCYHDRRQ